MKDAEVREFIEKHGIQIWPVRDRRYGPVKAWYVQKDLPFLQCYGHGLTLIEALTNLEKAIPPQ